MPAVNLLRLRTELNQLLWNFTDPLAFRASLSEILRKFAYTAYRSESSTRSLSTYPETQISLIVLREMDLALLPVIREQPQAALSLCELLWNDEDMEVCLIGSRILGEIPVEHSDLVLDRVEEWALQGVKRLTVRQLMKNATTTIMRTDPEILLRRIRQWYVDVSEEKNNICLEGLMILTENSDFENLPAIFTLLEALLSEATGKTQQTLYDLFLALLNRSPKETIYIIRAQLTEGPNITVRRIIRKILPLLPEETRPSIKDALREASRPAEEKKQ